jgi:hypothetical protein
MTRINPGQPPYRRPGRPAKPIERPKVPEQQRPSDALTWYLLAPRIGFSPLTVRENLIEAGFACWCPLRMVERRHARQITIRLEALWSPYLFAGLTSEQGLADIRQVIGVQDAVRSDRGQAIAIDHTALAKAWDWLAEKGGYLDHTHPTVGPWVDLREGDRLRVTSGPFEHLTATFSGFHRGKLKILVDILGRKTDTLVSPRQVIRAE